MTTGTVTYEQLTTALNNLGSAIKGGSNRFFPLTDPDQAWFITQGHVDIFSSRLEEEGPVGSRFHFFTAGQEELLFGMPMDQTASARGLIAVPSPDAALIRVDMNNLLTLWKNPVMTERLNDLFDIWIGRLSQGISKDINPRTDRMIEPGQGFQADANLKIRSRKGIVWVGFEKGDALFLGMKEIFEPGRDFLFPVSQDSWIQTTENAVIKSFTTGEVILRDDFLENLAHFYGIVSFCEFFNIRLITVDEYNRLNEKSVTHDRIRQGALVRIASVINDTLRRSYIDPSRDPLLTAVTLVAEYAGITVTEPKQPRSGEAPPLTLNDILRSSRFRSRKVRLDGSWWNSDNGPLLAFTREGNLPVALVPRAPGRYECVNPSGRVRQPLTRQVAETLQPEAQQFYRPLPDHPIGGMHLVRFGLKNCMKDILVIVGIGFAGGLLTLLLPVLTGAVFDQVIPQGDHRQLFVYALILLFSIVAIAFTQVVRRFAMIRIETKLDFTLQAAIWDRLLNLPVPFFRKYQAGQLASKANSIMMLRKVLSDTVIYTVLGSLFMMFNLFLLFFYDALLAFYAMGLIALSVAVILVLGRQIRQRQRIIIELQQKIFGMLFQFFSSISKIRIAGAEVHAFAEWAGKFSENKRQTYEVRKIYLKISLLSTLLPAMLTLMVFGIIAGGIPNTMSTGHFMAFFTALTVSVASFLQLGMAGVAYFTAIPMMESIRPILEATPENITLKPGIQDLTGDIEVVNVYFRYQPDSPLVLDNVSLHVRPGEFVAVVGASGSGKSTLLRLLLGFETPESGSVYYDRQDITSFDPSSVRRQAGTVLQQARLSTGNILTNITGMTNATFEDAWEAARAVGLDDDIRQMPMGMYTVITGGISTLSRGQRQRIMIARAIVNRPRILFFDEATSALDNKTQQIVSRSLEKLQATRVVIAHRLTTIQNADRIYVMDGGRIVETGTYTELLSMGGKFTDLVKRQMVE
ncbi:MAG: NHLP bacteriocin export ABC transporter permease/ATPase subunit [Bacteroidales bacterium]|nr:NHLP bacteriocin export ABC transporter permease/ATPase subunit [Bacteroidales bacterium]